MKVSYDVVNLHTSVLIDKAITVLIDTSNNEVEEIKIRKKLALEHKYKEITEAIEFHIMPKTFRPPVDDSRAFSIRNYAFQGVRNVSFAEIFAYLLSMITLRILNQQYPAIRYAIKYDDHNKSVNFLDINLTNTINDKYEL